MKKLIYLAASSISIMLFIAMLSLTGCSVSSEQTSTSNNEKDSIKEKKVLPISTGDLSYSIEDSNAYYYYKVGNKWAYDGTTRYLGININNNPMPVMQLSLFHHLKSLTQFSLNHHKYMH